MRLTWTEVSPVASAMSSCVIGSSNRSVEPSPAASRRTANPHSMCATPRNGSTPDAQLVDGLTLIERQIAEMSEQLAQGDLDSLATRGRYLQIKYRGDETDR